MADRSKIGWESPPFTWEVERGKIRELVQAIGDKNPIYLDREAAKREGYADTPAPPTFVTVPMMWTGILIRVIKELRINFSRVLHGEEGYEYYREIYPGDVLTGKIRVVAVDEKTGKAGAMDLVRLETLYTNQHNETVIRASTLIVERK